MPTGYFGQLGTYSGEGAYWLASLVKAALIFYFILFLPRRCLVRGGCIQTSLVKVVLIQGRVLTCYFCQGGAYSGRVRTGYFGQGGTYS